MQHADKLIERIIFVDALLNLHVLDPLHIGRNVKEVLDCDLAANVDAPALSGGRAAIRSLSGVKRTCAPPISHPEPEWDHCAPATAALESGAYAERAAGEQDAAIRTARNAPMRIEEHIDANE